MTFARYEGSDVQFQLLYESDSVALARSEYFLWTNPERLPIAVQDEHKLPGRSRIPAGFSELGYPEDYRIHIAHTGRDWEFLFIEPSIPRWAPLGIHSGFVPALGSTYAAQAHDGIWLPLLKARIGSTLISGWCRLPSRFDGPDPQFQKCLNEAMRRRYGGA